MEVDLTKPKRPDNAFIVHRCYFECKRINGAGVSHIEVLCDFLQDHWGPCTHYITLRGGVGGGSVIFRYIRGVEVCSCVV